MLALLSEDWSVWRAAKKARPDKLKQLLAVELQPRVAVNRKHPVRGITPLMATVSAPSTTNSGECVQILISYGADVTAVSSTKHKNTALHYAAQNNKATAIDELLNAGANIFARNNDGFTALDVAWMHGRQQAAHALMERIQLHSGWLDLSSKVAMPRWKRRWCAVLACDSEESSVELCVFREPDQVRPDEILVFNSNTAIVVPPWSSFEFHLDGVKVQPLRHRLRIPSPGTQRQRASEYQREFAFASEMQHPSNDRQLWVSALKVCSSLNWKRERMPSIKQRSRRSWIDASSQRTASIPDEPPSLEFSSLHSWESTRPLITSPDYVDPHQDVPCCPCGHTSVCRACLQAIREQLRQKQRNNCPVCHAH